MKKLILIMTTFILCLVLLTACAKVEEGETTTISASETQTALETTTAAESTTAEESTTPETTAEETTTEEALPFLKGGYWYLFDDEKEECYAVSFEGGGKASVAYFDSENIEGEDAEYFTGSAEYSVDGKKIEINVSTAMGELHFELTAKKEKLYYGKKELQRFDKLSLDIVFDHFYEE